MLLGYLALIQAFLFATRDWPFVQKHGDAMDQMMVILMLLIWTIFGLILLNPNRQTTNMPKPGITRFNP